MFANSIYLVRKSLKWVYIPLFFSLCIVFNWIHLRSFDLENFSPEIVSLSTLQKFDISLRLSAFYSSVFIFIGCFIFIGFIIGLLQRYQIISRISIRILNYLSFTGLVFLVILLFQGSGKYFIELVMISQSIVAVQDLIIKYFYKRSNVFIPNEIYLWSLILAISALFPIRELFSYTARIFSLALYYKFYFVLNLLILNTYLVVSSRTKLSNKTVLSWFYPMAWLPGLSILSVEIPQILNQRGVNLLSAKYIYIALFLALITWIGLNIVFKRPLKTSRIVLQNKYAPLFVTGIVAFVYYQPFLPQSVDIFELGNPANSVMRLFDFTEIPMVDFLSSHMLSEQLFPYLYVLLNGYNGSLDFLTYNFLIYPIASLIVYFFFIKIFRRIWMSIFLALLFPYLFGLLPVSYAVLLISILLFYRLYNEYSLKKLLVFALWTAFLLSWKPEVGLANFYASSILLSIFLFNNFKRKVILDYVKVLTIILILAGSILGALSFFTESSILVNFKKAIIYFTANQAHGFSMLTYHFNRLFQLHYFVFPALVLTLTLAMILKTFKQTVDNKHRNLYWVILFLVIVYLVAAQRGLVRHNMFDTSMWISGPLFLILGLMLIYLLSFRFQVRVGMVFIIIATLLVGLFTFPENEKFAPVFDQYLSKFLRFDKIWGPMEQGVSRTKDPDRFVQKNFGDLNRYLDESLKDEETFYDFSNTPMAYFYAKRRVPGYFNQNPICINTRELEKLHLIEIEKLKMPVVVFNNVPQTYWDHVDRVPNELRHNLIANYLFQHYYPAYIINKHTIWLNNEQYLVMRERTDSLVQRLQPKSTQISLRKKDAGITNQWFVRAKIEKFSPTYSLIVNGFPVTAWYNPFYQAFEAILPPSVKESTIIVAANDTLHEISLFQSKYSLDTVSRKAQKFDLMKLPYVEGQYGKQSNSIAEEKLSEPLVSGKGRYVCVPASGVMVNQFNTIQLQMQAVKQGGKITCSYYKNGGEQGSFIFDVVPSDRATNYIIPVASQFNWFNFGADSLVFELTNLHDFPIESISLIAK